MKNINGQKPNKLLKKPIMPVDYVFFFYKKMQNLGIEIWLDGGWGVDALLEKQTREHEDLDIVIQQKNVNVLRKMLETEGFIVVPRDDTRPCNFVMGDDKGHLIDFHVINVDEEGNGLYGPEEDGVMFPAASLTGAGKIKGLKVKCISPEYIVMFHCQYRPDENDYKDVLAVCQKFKIPFPKEYQHFKRDKNINQTLTPSVSPP